uniref:Uncharacterized protein n=1 Tax=Eutreptiella gymnastica TaxID=73025 RepID=A0A7S4G5P2_9EUGL
MRMRADVDALVTPRAVAASLLPCGAHSLRAPMNRQHRAMGGCSPPPMRVEYHRTTGGPNQCVAAVGCPGPGQRKEPLLQAFLDSGIAPEDTRGGMAQGSQQRTHGGQKLGKWKIGGIRHGTESGVREASHATWQRGFGALGQRKGQGLCQGLRHWTATVERRAPEGMGHTMAGGRIAMGSHV